VRNGYPNYFGRGTLSLPGFSLKQIEREAALFEFRVYRDIDRVRAVRGLAQSIVKRYPALYRGVKKALVATRLWHSGGWHRPHDDVTVMGSDSRMSTRPTAGISDTVAHNISHSAGS